MKSMYTAWLRPGPETDALLRGLRDIPQSERDKMPAEDFAGPHKSFPIQKPEDVAAAAHSLGRAKGDRQAIKAKIIAIAYRKGAEYVAQLPETWKKKAAKAAESRHYHLRGCTGKIRTAKFNGRDHVVVPVTALIEGVIHPSNVKDPEFVPESSFTVAPQGWNGRPIMSGHPLAADGPVSANSPEVLESAFGTVFGAVAGSKRLQMEGWIDPEKAVTAAQKRTLERLQAGESVEVSVGAFVTTLEESGVFNGKKYSRVWQDITPDHLAFLEEGDTGACSVAMGCGTARMHTMSARGLEFEGDDAPPEVKAKGLRERIAGWLEHLGAVDKGMSDTEVRQDIMDALKEADPNAMWIEAVYDQYVVYCQSTPVPDAYGGFTTGSRYMQQEYSIDTAGAVTFTGDPVEVEPVMSYEQVTAANRNNHNEGDDMKTKAERIKALIANPRAKFTTADQAMLEAASDDRLTAFEAAAGECPCKAKIDKILANKRLPFVEADRPALEAMTEERLTALAAIPETDPAAETPEQKKKREDDAAAAAAGNTPAPLSEEAYLAQAPQSVRDLVSRQKAQDATRRTELVKTLKAAQQEYTETELGAMPLDQLERLARATKAPVPEIDYSLRGAPRAAGETPKAAPKPPDLNARILAQRGVKTA